MSRALKQSNRASQTHRCWYAQSNIFELFLNLCKSSTSNSDLHITTTRWYHNDCVRSDINLLSLSNFLVSSAVRLSIRDKCLLIWRCSREILIFRDTFDLLLLCFVIPNKSTVQWMKIDHHIWYQSAEWFACLLVKNINFFQVSRNTNVYRHSGGHENTSPFGPAGTWFRRVAFQQSLVFPAFGRILGFELSEPGHFLEGCWINHWKITTVIALLIINGWFYNCELINVNFLIHVVFVFSSEKV